MDKERIMKCGDEKCQQRAEDTHEEVFNKPDGLKERMMKVERKKIPWMALTWILPLFIGIMGTLGGFIYGQVEKNQEKNVITSERVTRLEEKYASINTKQDETITLLKELLSKKEKDKKEPEKPVDKKVGK